ncbi:dual adapter for phosphotyrosine and 3-phosphotyrosine and 3-phosphoinositide-like [Clytia hemisphaerica]|uniref:Dual adapter for phosphotyrosine and 3-phosphotyrosine and 3-phosphoinositide n=2 Tax=Clytia hemisphaerica TaxID=252671 RepID=A0A7M5WZ07_9CNID|eukprot:TCONS_00025460-protein
MSGEVEHLPWFHPNLNRHQTEALLLHNGQDGSYLIRSSTSHEGEYSLSVKCANSVKHFQIGWNGNEYVFGMGKFSNIEDFVSHFENKPLIGGETGVLILLRYPYPRHVEEPTKYDTIRVHAEWGNRPSSQHADDAHIESLNSKEGYLTKQGGRRKNWKARWFVLERNLFRYYKTKGEAQPIRTLDLDKCLEIDQDFECGKDNTIKVVMPGRTFLIYASTPTEKDDWLKILKWKIEKLHNAI